MVGIVDPPRAEARAAIAKCHSAGIQVRMITGDHAVTAGAIGHELGIEGKALTGAEFAAMSDDDLKKDLWPRPWGFVVFSLFNMAIGLTVRDEDRSVFNRDIISDRRQLGLFGLSLLFAWLPVELGFPRFLGLTRLTGYQWLLAFGLAFALVLIDEMIKFVRRRRQRRTADAGGPSPCRGRPPHDFRDAGRGRLRASPKPINVALREMHHARRSRNGDCHGVWGRS